MLTVAVDWSGDARSTARLWTAEVADGHPTALAAGRTRAGVIEHLVDLAAHHDDVLVGLDFSFSLPVWFADHLGCADIEALWRAVAVHGEAWLASCAWPFWGRPGVVRPQVEQWRATEADLVVRGRRPASTFQIGGAGAVGTGSLRGMPHLPVLRRAGYAIWPFDPPSRRTVVEIWPRTFAPEVVKSSRVARTAAVHSMHPPMPPRWAAAMAASDDAFDAAVSAVALDAVAAALPTTPAPAHPDAKREGWIWPPASLLSGAGAP